MVRTIEKTPEIAPAEGAAYERDFYSWANEQAVLLRSGRLSELDVMNVAEELEDMGKSQFWRLESAIKIVLMHMLKWDHQPERRTRSWVQTIAEHRRRVTRLLSKSPGMKSRIPEAIEGGYEDARGWAAIETRYPEEDFPEKCPYEWDDVLNRRFDLDGLEVD